MCLLRNSNPEMALSLFSVNRIYIQRDVRQEVWVVVPILNSSLSNLDLLSFNFGCFLTTCAAVTSSTFQLSDHACDLLSLSLADVTQAEAFKMPVRLGVPLSPLASHGSCVSSPQTP